MLTNKKRCLTPLPRTLLPGLRKGSTMAAVSDPVKTAMKWIGLVLALGTLVGGSVTVLSTYVFAQKEDVTKLEKHHDALKGSMALRDYRIERLEVQVQNIESIARRTDLNVEKLLTVQRIAPAPIPVFKALPSIPAPATVEADPGG